MREIHRVRTPENVLFEFELASLPARALAWGLDVLVVVALVLAVTRVISAIAIAPGFVSAIAIVAFFALQWGYGALTEWWWGGQTIGKRVVGLRVLDEQGLRIGLVPAVLRNLVRIVDFLPAFYLVGGIAALADGRGRRLGDVAAGTIVVRERPAAAPAALVAASERHNTFLSDPVVLLAARRLTAPERDAMIALGMRRELLPLEVRHDLFARLAEHLETRLAIPRPPFFSPEKYVLHLTAAALDAPAHHRG